MADLKNKRILFYGFATSNYFFREVIKALLAQGHDKSNLGIVFPNGQYARFYDDALPPDNVCYLYKNYNAVLKQVKSDRNLSVVQQNFPDNPFMILSADKSGFRRLPSDRQILNLEAIYRIYNGFIESFQPDYIVFPDIEVVDGYLLYNIAKARGIPIAYTFHLRNLGQSVLGEDIREKFPPYFGCVNESGEERAKYFQTLSEKKLPKPDFFNHDWDEGGRAPAIVNHAIIRFLKGVVLRLTSERHYLGEDTFCLKFLVAILPLLEKWRAFKYKKFIQPSMPIRSLLDFPEKFYLYALQVTPESSINYLSPLYIDQIRAIDEIRQALPPGTWLVVKEHPAIIGARDDGFYRHLRKMPGVLLADALLPMEVFVEKCDAIFTITGTVGLECLFNKKPCYMFGENFFSHYLPNKKIYPDVRDFTKLDFGEVMAERHDAFIADLPRIFSVAHPFYLVDPLSSPYVLMRNNIVAYVRAMEDHYAMTAAARAERMADAS